MIATAHTEDYRKMIILGRTSSSGNQNEEPVTIFPHCIKTNVTHMSTAQVQAAQSC